jgi:prepilin-type N-terminal cleavage/methylation domain-containing protein
MKTGQQGFSLVEVMVAILILGVALAGLTHGITTALVSSKDSELQATAAMFAAGKIETLQAEQDVENGETDGDCGAGLESYHWKQTITASDTDGLHEVVVSVTDVRSKQEVFELRTLLFQTGDETVDKKGKKKAGDVKQ